MNNIQKRFLLFLGICIPTRSLLTYLSYKIKKEYLVYLGIFTLVIAIGFFRIVIFGSKSADSQLQWLGEDKVWWNHLRLFHGFLYFIFSILAFKKNKYSWIFLGFDTLIGFLSFLDNSIKNEYFSKLF